MSTTSSNRRKWLRRAGLIIGLVWAGWMTIVLLVMVESHLTAAIIGIPLLACVAVAWRWGLAGGVILIIVGLFSAVQEIMGLASIVIGGAIFDPLEMMAGALFTAWPPLASGILLLLWWREGRRPPRVAETSIGLSDNVTGLLCYLLGWVTGLLFIRLEPKSRFVRYHAAQSIIIFSGLTIVLLILGYTLPDLLAWLWWLVILAGLVLWFVLMGKAYEGTMFKLPWAGNIAEKWVSKP